MLNCTVKCTASYQSQKEELSEEWSDLLTGEGLESYYNMTEEEARVYNGKKSV